MNAVGRVGLLAAVSWTALAGATWAQTSPAQTSQSSANEVEEVVVTGVPFGVTQRATTIATDVLDEETLAVAPSASIGDLLSGRPGVRSSSFAPGASRPVIRGLTGPRVQVLTNGIGLIDASSVSPDHQVAADPGEAERIEIVRGPATLVYGGSAIGGVVNIIDGRIPTERVTAGPDGIVSVQASSVDEGRSGLAHVTVGSGPFAFSIDGVSRRTDDYAIPSSPISQALADATGIERPDLDHQPNSYSELDTWGAGASLLGDNGYIGASYKDTDSEYGTVAEEGVFIALKQQRWDVRGEHRFNAGPVDSVRGAYGHADYTHTEFEGPGEPGTNFESDGQEGRVDLIMRERGGWNQAYGVQGLSRSFEAIGDEAFLPAADISEFGVFTVQRLDRARHGFEGGLRFDRRTLEATPFGAADQVTREFDNWSGSVAAFVRPAAGLFLGLSLSRTERAPSEVELFADGVHIATAAYERGDPTLDSETVVTLEGTVHYDRGAFTGDLHVYASNYDGFIDEFRTGEIFETDEGDVFPIYQFVQTGAEFRGFELEGAYALWEQGDRRLTLEGAADYVRAETDLGRAARIPPYSVTGRLAWTSTPFDVSGEVRRVGEQDRTATSELPTEGYTLVNLYGAVRPFADRAITLFAEGRNLTDEEAREHASFLKDIAVLPGRNFRAGVSYRF